jgi:cytochrome c-type biogenesis protein CcmH/NrfF
MLRDSIQAMAKAGMSSDSIVALVVRAYGPDVRAEPLTRGAGLWAWVIPPVGLIAGILLVGVVLAHRHRRDGPTEDEIPDSPIDPADAERLKEAMKEMDEAEEPAF